MHSSSPSRRRARRSRRSKASRPGEELHPVQQAYHEQHGLQCGYCTPGLLLATVDLLERNPSPSEAEIREYLAGNVCRCTGYVGVVAAVQEAARKLEEGGPDGGDRDRRPVRRQRDPARGGSRLLRGRGKLRRRHPAARDCCTRRSSAARTAHARITRIDASAARELDGVALVLTAEDIERHLAPIATGLPARGGRGEQPAGAARRRRFASSASRSPA